MKSNQKLTLLFWNRKSKPNSDGSTPVYCRISIDGSEEELATGRKVQPEEWDKDLKRAKGFPDSKRTNLRLNQITTDLERHFTLLQLDYEQVGYSTHTWATQYHSVWATVFFPKRPLYYIISA